MKQKIKLISILLVITVFSAFLYLPVVGASNAQPIKCHPYSAISISYKTKLLLLSKIEFSGSFRRATDILNSENSSIDLKHPFLKAAVVNNKTVYEVEFPVKSPYSSEIKFAGFVTRGNIESNVNLHIYVFHK